MKRGLCFTPGLLGTDELTVQKTEITHVLLSVEEHIDLNLQCFSFIRGFVLESLQILQPFQLMKPFNIPTTLFKTSTFQEIKQLLFFFFPFGSWKVDILEGLPPRVAARSHRSHSTYRNKLINHWYSYLPLTFNVLHSQGWQCDQKVRVALQTVSDPAVPCPQTDTEKC